MRCVAGADMAGGGREREEDSSGSTERSGRETDTIEADGREEAGRCETVGRTPEAESRTGWKGEGIAATLERMAGR